MAFTVTVRVGPKVSREKHETLDQALTALGVRLVSLEREAARDRKQFMSREYTPVAQVGARAEITEGGRLLGKSLGGIDVRGDGSAEAYVGKVRRQLVEQQRGETALDALRRVLTAPE